ncbi:MAG: hypothetical protein J6S75_06835, partial [Thermoguttaceae bacterium]|nr:hypothetical protein [Thermoguttaceae bacterium]
QTAVAPLAGLLTELNRQLFDFYHTSDLFIKFGASPSGFARRVPYSKAPKVLFYGYVYAFYGTNRAYTPIIPRFCFSARGSRQRRRALYPRQVLGQPFGTLCLMIVSSCCQYSGPG